MKKLLKILGYSLGILILLVIVLLVVAKLSENKITQMALKKVSTEIQAPVAIREVSFNLLRKFPLASIELRGVSFCGQSDTACSAQPDTLLQLNKVYVAVKSQPLMKGIIEIMKIDIEDATVSYLVDTAGVSSIDFLMAQDTTQVPDTSASAPLDLTLTDLSVKNMTCYYRDSSLGIAARVKIPHLKMKGKMNEETMAGTAKGQIQVSQVAMAETPLHLMQEALLNIDADYNNDSVVIRTLELDTEGASLSLSGGAKMGNSISTNLTLNRAEFSIAQLAKYIPEKLLKDFGIRQVAGNVELAGTINGNYSETELPRVDMTLQYHNGHIFTNDYPELKNFSCNATITNGVLQNNQSTQIDFRSLGFETANSKFQFALSVLDVDHPKYNIQTKMDIDLAEFKPYVPDSLVKQMSGRLALILNTRGVLPEAIGDDFTDKVLANTQMNLALKQVHLEMDSVPAIDNLSGRFAYTPGAFSMDSLAVKIPDYQVDIQNSSLKSRYSGSVNNLAKLSVMLDQFALNMGRSGISGTLQVSNLEHPTYKAETRIHLDLPGLRKMLPDSLVSHLDGNITAHIKSEATINPDSIEAHIMEVIFTKGAYSAEFSNVSATMPDYPDYTVADLSGKFTMDTSAITLNKTSGKAAGITFAIDSTTIENVYETILLNHPEKLAVDTRIALGNLDYAYLMGLMPAEDSTEVKNDAESDTIPQAPQNYTMEIKGVAKIKSFTYDSVYLSNFSTLFNVRDSVYTVDQLQFDAFGGHLNTSANYILQPEDKVIVQMRNSIRNMDIHKLLADFKDFEEFYKPAIRSENISGKLTCDFYTRLDMIGDSILMDDIRVRGDFQLAEGGVYNFEPATELSKFTNINELDNIQFKNLNSKIFIMQGAIFVPQTYISSTALDITAYGMQAFGEDYEYHLKLHLRDIMLGKSNKLLKEQAKMGDIAEGDDRDKAAYLVSYSLDGKVKNGFDKKKLQSSMRTKIRLSEKLLDVRFHPDLFKFKTKVYPVKE